jgi:hypothetical protein
MLIVSNRAKSQEEKFMDLKNILKVSGCFEHFAVFAFLILLIFALDIPARAAAGYLDRTFGGVGALKLTNPHILSRISVQADGKILSSGSVRSGSYDNPVYTGYLARFTANGGYIFAAARWSPDSIRPARSILLSAGEKVLS